MKTNRRAGAATIALLAGVSACAANTDKRTEDSSQLAQGLTAAGVLPGGTAIKVSLDTPADGATVAPDAVNVTGTVDLGVGLPVARTLLVYTLDVSGSTMNTGACGGDRNHDGVSNTTLDCEIAAVSALNAKAAATGTVLEVGVAILGTNGAAGDVGPDAGFQFVTAPSTDANGNGALDIDDVLATADSSRTGGLSLFTPVSVGLSTNYGAGIAASLSVITHSRATNPIVVFVSDGLNNVGENVSTWFGTTPGHSIPSNVIFDTFAVGSGAACATTASPLGTLQQLADHTHGTCTEVTDFSKLEDLVPAVIDSQLTAVDLTLDGVAVPAATVTPALPHNGPQTFSFQTTLAHVSAGSHTLCATASGTDGGGPGSVKVCNTFRANSPPIARCHDVTVPADATCHASGSIDAGSSDPDGDAITCVQAPSGPNAPGATSTTLTCTDPYGAMSSCSALVNVVDTTPPVIACPASLVLECTAGGASATYASAATDNCGAASSACAPASGSTFPAGVNSVTCSAADASGNAASCAFSVTVRDTTPPVVTIASTVPSLWPPDHRYVDVPLHDCVASISDACGGALAVDTAARITRITSDEGEDVNGSGNTCEDAVIVGSTTARLRAERTGNGDGRVYTVFFTASDAAGNATASSCRVVVPHDQSGRDVADSGCAYCTGTGCGTCAGHSASCH